MAWKTVEKSNVRVKFVERETVTLVQVNPEKGIEKITSVNEDGRVTDIIKPDWITFDEPIEVGDIITHGWFPDDEDVDRYKPIELIKHES